MDKTKLIQYFKDEARKNGFELTNIDLKDRYISFDVKNILNDKGFVPISSTRTIKEINETLIKFYSTKKYNYYVNKYSSYLIYRVEK